MKIITSVFGGVTTAVGTIIFAGQTAVKLGLWMGTIYVISLILRYYTTIIHHKTIFLWGLGSKRISNSRIFRTKIYFEL